MLGPSLVHPPRSSRTIYPSPFVHASTTTPNDTRLLPYTRHPGHNTCRTVHPFLRPRSFRDPHVHERRMEPSEARPPLSVFSPWRIERRSINHCNFIPSVSFSAPSLSRRRNLVQCAPSHPDPLSYACQSEYHITSLGRTASNPPSDFTPRGTRPVRTAVDRSTY